LKAPHVKSTLESLYRYPSVSVGIGLVYWHSLARFELNFCLPLVASKSDRIHPGFQFGFGINFL
jgi:outer membrane protein insertion porin family